MPTPPSSFRRAQGKRSFGKPVAGKGARRPSTDGAPAARAERGERSDFSPGRPRSQDGQRARSLNRSSSRDQTRTGERTASPRAASRYERNERSDRLERTEHPSRGDHTTRDARPARPRRGEMSDRSQRVERPERAPRVSRDDRGDSARRFDGAEHRDRPGRPPARRPRTESAPRRDRDGLAPRSFAPARVDEVVERYHGTMITADSDTAASFEALGIGGQLAAALRELGAASPFPIQSATIPESLTGRDILARGHTGSGKTIAFGAALVERLCPGQKRTGRREFGRAPQALILAPTRELALQIDRTVQPLARTAGLFTTQIVGGVPQGRQVGALKRGVDIVIGTPGRLEDLIAQGHLDVSGVWITVVDEADHMAELGFLEPVQRLLRGTQSGGQKLLFSATLDRAVATLVDEFLVEPAIFELTTGETHNPSIEHHVFVIDQRDKREIIRGLTQGSGKTLVFTRTRAFAEELSDFLDDEGVPSVSLHGDLNQSRRQRNLDKLTSGRVNVLVATDVAARGIHVDDIALVIHADPAEEHKTYVHRSGRTGRAGGTGRVVTLTTPSRQRHVDGLLNRAGIEATTVRVRAGDHSLEEFVGA